MWQDGLVFPGIILTGCKTVTVPIPITLMRNIQGNYVINGSYLGLLSSKTQLMNKNTILGNFILKKNIFPDFQAERDEKENSFLLKFRG